MNDEKQKLNDDCNKILQHDYIKEQLQDSNYEFAMNSNDRTSKHNINKHIESLDADYQLSSNKLIETSLNFKKTPQLLP